MPDRVDADLDLPLGVLALRLDSVDAKQFADACALRSVRRDRPPAAVLVSRGWITDLPTEGFPDVSTH